MTSPVPDALRTQLAEVLAVWMAKPFPPEPWESRNAEDASFDLWPYVEAALARASAEAKAEALRPVREFVDATWTERDHELLHPALRSASIRARLLRVLDAAALSAAPGQEQP